jgi:class 3 adenylate cyclase/tetratricopeptide (TPR) repeat protein
MPLLTMVFTDVVASSAAKRDASLGRDNRERDHAYLTKVQTPHFELVRACCIAHGGQEVSTMGDAFFLTFEDPTAAVRCAACIHQRLAEHPIETPAGPLRLRIGIHSGFPEFFEGSWHGTDVDTAARVAGTATERQILISSRTYELVRQMTDVKFHSRGEFAMKGVERMVLWEADWDGKGPRATAIPPLDAGRRRKRNLSIAGAVAGTILVVAAGVYFYRSYKSGRVSMPVNTRPTVAVVGFKNLGQPDVEWLSNALSEMLSTELGSSDSVRTISPEDVSTAKMDLGLAIVPTYNIATLLKIRRILHSEYVISGAYVAMGSAGSDSIHIDVHLQDADTGEAVSSLAEDGTIANLPELLKKVATDVRSRLGVQNQSQSAGEKAQATAALPSNPEALRTYTEGVAKLRVFDALGARELLERAVALEPNLALPHMGLARAWELLGYDEKARGEAKLAVERSEGLPPRDQRAIEAEYHEMNSQWDQAISIYQALWVLYPDEPDYALELASVQTAAGQGREALNTLQKLESLPQMAEDPRIELARALAAQSMSDVKNQRDAATAAAEQAKQQGSRLLAAKAYWQLCSALYNMGELANAENACNQSMLAAPFDEEMKARSMTGLANILEAEGKTREALDMRRQILETARKIGSQKDIIGALQNLADLVDAQGNAKEAREDYDEALRTARTIGDKPALIKLENNLAGDLYADGNFSGAAALYQQALETAREIDDKRGMAMALESVVYIQMLRGHLTDAQNNLQQAIDLQKEAGLQSDRANGLDMLGDVLMAKGDVEKARASYEESLKLSTEQNAPSAIASSRAELASLEIQQGHAAQAVTLSRQAAEEFASEKLIDNEADARNTLARALLQEGKPADARAETDRGVALAPRDRTIHLELEVSDARLKAREGKAAEAQKELATSAAEAERMELAGLRLQIELAQAEVEAGSNPTAARAKLQAVENDARAKGYLGIVAEAQSKQKELPR